jgi:hypothetical protein
MYFWRIEELKAQMATRPLSTREELPYLVAWAALTSIAMTLQYVWEANLWDYLGGVWSVVLAVIGTIYIYQCNGGADGQFFLQRYFAIGWVVSLRWLVVLLILAAIYIPVLDFLNVLQDETTWHESLILAIFETIILLRIGHHVRDVATRSSSQITAPADGPSHTPL